MIERRLLEERARLSGDLSRYRAEAQVGLQEASGDLSAARLHMADEGSDTMDQELDASNAARQTGQLSEIDAALERLYQNPERFGICELDGKDIPFERLDIIPWARTCGQHEA